jgi:hypothetical protein
MRNPVASKWLLLFLIAAISFCCKRRQGEYIYYEKWVIGNILNQSPLKGKPGEVKEIYYNNLDDTSFNAPGPQASYELYKFDRSGNNVFTRYYFGGTLISEANCTYGPNGPERLTYWLDSLSAVKEGNKRRSIAEKIAENKFKITSYSDSSYDHHYIISFSPDGQTVKEERWESDKPVESSTRFYTKNKLMREQTIRQKNRSEEIYYYSNKGFLDSIIVFDNDQLSGSKVYINNEHGDAVLYIKTGKNGIEEKRRMKYQYDKQGNWIRKLEYIEIGDHITIAVPDQKFRGYSMAVREIKY